MPNEQAALWRMPAIRKLLMVSLLGFTSFDLTLSSLPSWAVSGGASIDAAGLVTAVFLLVTVLIQMVVPALVARIGAGRVLALGLLALGSPAPLCAVTHDLRWLVVISTVRGRVRDPHRRWNVPDLLAGPCRPTWRVCRALRPRPGDTQPTSGPRGCRADRGWVVWMGGGASVAGRKSSSGGVRVSRG